MGWPWSRKPDRDRTDRDRTDGIRTDEDPTHGIRKDAAVDAERFPNSSSRHPPGGQGVERAPAAPSASRPPPRESAAPGLAAFLEGVSADGRHAVLDLGHAAGPKLSLYAPYARRMRFLDLLRPTGGAATWEAALAGIPRQDQHPYDLILGWDILDRLPPEHHGALMARLAQVSAPVARLHLLADASPPGQPSPGSFRFTPVAVDRMEAEEETSEDPVSASASASGSASATASPSASASHRPRRLQPAQVERLLLPFRVTRGFTLRLGLREFVAVRRDERPISDRGGTGGS